MRAILTVIGKDKVGIIAKVSQTLADLNLNIVDVTQTILNDYFTMMMVLESQEKVDFKTIREQLDQTAEQLGVDIRIQNAEIFDAMHKL
ncbi:ACT domain-containing protein [uncultured Enterococcus sp.]|uniref:ACT domain-containing protein n=1 Tax=uncultured Enterococcus sp. TaxID=167972 RepID=UPI00200A3FCC|nr:ACT domain-containing protein [Enterococcus cecorum]